MQYFMDDTFNGLRAMSGNCSKEKFVAYQLNDVSHSWFEIWERKNSFAALSLIWVDLK